MFFPNSPFRGRRSPLPRSYVQLCQGSYVVYLIQEHSAPFYCHKAVLCLVHLISGSRDLRNSVLSCDHALMILPSCCNRIGMFPLDVINGCCAQTSVVLCIEEGLYVNYNTMSRELLLRCPSGIPLRTVSRSEGRLRGSS